MRLMLSVGVLWCTLVGFARGDLIYSQAPNNAAQTLSANAHTIPFVPGSAGSKSDNGPPGSDWSDSLNFSVNTAGQSAAEASASYSSTLQSNYLAVSSTVHCASSADSSTVFGQTQATAQTLLDFHTTDTTPRPMVVHLHADYLAPASNMMATVGFTLLQGNTKIFSVNTPFPPITADGVYSYTATISGLVTPPAVNTVYELQLFGNVANEGDAPFNASLGGANTGSNVSYSFQLGIPTPEPSAIGLGLMGAGVQVATALRRR